MISFSDFIAILGLVGAAVGALLAGAKIILNAYHKKETEITSLKAEFRKTELAAIKGTIEQLQKVTSEHARKIQDATLALEKSYLRYNAQVDAVKAVSDQLKEVSHEIRDDLKQVRSVLTQVTQDVSILKSRKAH